MLTVGVDVGGTKLLGVVATREGEVVAERLRPTAEEPDAVLADVAAMVADLRAEVPEAAAAGVGAAGLVDLDGVMRHAPNLARFEGVEVRARLEAACGLPVAVDNDANAAALGELLYGAARGRSEALVVTLGTGIGGGIVAGGRVYRGGQGLAAEVGHVTVDPDGPRCACGAHGHWEAIASGRALGRMGQEWAARGEAPGVLARAGGDPKEVSGSQVGESALAGEADGLAILSAYARAVALGLGGLVNVLDPEVVVVAGGLVELGDVLLDRVRTELAAFVVGSGHRTLPPIVVAELGERAGAIGAAALARTLLP